MKKKDLTAVILCGGKGTRYNSKKKKSIKTFGKNKWKTNN